ncbi:MAG: lysyl oxidase family protein [Actinomycetota bacterium]|nr:lysyl oxidase family protein [Actinomycetota bacterium]
MMLVVGGCRAATPPSRKVLRFTYTTPNFGDGDLIVGRPEDHPEWFEFGECHGHYHFREYADYRLWTPDQYAQYEALRQENPDLKAAEVLAQNPGLQPVVGEKRGFCVIDIWFYAIAPPKYLVCDFQGISTGWADEYYEDLDSQFIDITGVAPGTYVLEAEVNSEWAFEESDYTNNRATNTVQI